jgi:hypothetical protein
MTETLLASDSKTTEMLGSAEANYQLQAPGKRKCARNGTDLA